MVEIDNFDLDVMQANGTECANKSLTSPQDVESHATSHFDSEFQNCTSETYHAKNSILHILSQIYAEFLVILAGAAVFTEILHGPVNLFQIHVYFYFYLLGLSIVIFLLSFIRKLICTVSREDIHLKCKPEVGEGNSGLSISRYLQFGAVVCGLAVFLFTCLRSLTVFLAPTTCVNSLTSALFITQSAFIAFQLAFFLMNMKELCSIFGCFHKIAVMHLLATNAALLLYLVLWESSKDWQEAIHINHNSSTTWSRKEMNISVHSIESSILSSNQSQQFPTHVVHVTSNCYWRYPDSEVSEDIVSIQLCLQNSYVGMLWKKTSEFLYPIMAQYYLIIIFMLQILWRSEKFSCEEHCLTFVKLKKTRLLNFSLSKGFYLGCIIFVTSVISVLLHEILDIMDYSVVLSELCFVFGSAIIAALVGLSQIKSVLTSYASVNQNFINPYQRIGLYFVFMYGACSLIVGCLSGEKYHLFLLFEILFMIFHAVLQYIFLIQISTMHIQSHIRMRSQVIIFLVFCNASLWILECFIFWNGFLTDLQLKVYGFVVWPIIMRIVIPCLVFYRFHSAVALLESWRISAM